MSKFRMLQVSVGHALISKDLVWRHHGIGVLQAYLYEGKDEIRVHIWHPDLIRKEFTEYNGLVHDHRFDFHSTVLLGKIWHEEFVLRLGTSDSKWVMHEVVPARTALKETGDYNVPLGKIDNVIYSVNRQGIWKTEGDSYFFESRKFHLTSCDHLAVTIVQKSNVVDGNARILIHEDKQIVHAFENPVHNEQITPYINNAYRKYINDAHRKLCGIRYE